VVVTHSRPKRTATDARLSQGTHHTGVWFHGAWVKRKVCSKVPSGSASFRSRAARHVPDQNRLARRKHARHTRDTRDHDATRPHDTTQTTARHAHTRHTSSRSSRIRAQPPFTPRCRPCSSFRRRHHGVRAGRVPCATGPRRAPAHVQSHDPLRHTSREAGEGSAHESAEHDARVPFCRSAAGPEAP
jgi:hypothetical protein